jgi:hypothetical protein
MLITARLRAGARQPNALHRTLFVAAKQRENNDERFTRGPNSYGLEG